MTRARPARTPRARHTQAPRLLAANTPSPHELWAGAPRAPLAGLPRVLNVTADVFDLRDRQYPPMLAPLPAGCDFRREVPRVLDQGDEGACAGFALAAMVDFLLARRGTRFQASPRFLYENARRYDEWRGADYEGTSIRGAMKGFHRHGACSERVLPYVPRQRVGRLPQAALDDAAERPLGAYYRVSTSSINDLQSALAEVGIVLASAHVHRGWDRLGRAGRGLPRIGPDDATTGEGGHAFALVGYTRDGFIVQNSWGADWGAGGFALLGYDDWLRHRMDAWVAQLGVGPVRYHGPAAPGPARAGGGAVTEGEIHGHYVAIAQGALDTYGDIRTFPEDLDDVAARVKARARAWRASARRPLKLLLWAHGGLVEEAGAAARVRDRAPRWLDRQVYPIHLIWHTGLWEEIGDLLASKRDRVARVAGEERVRGWLKDKLRDARDGLLEVAARPLGMPIWSEMKADARRAVTGADGSGVGPALRLLDALEASGAPIEIHLAGHSAGSILHCHLFEALSRRGRRVASMTFVAPAVSTALFRSTVIAHDAMLGRFALHTMPDADERADRCGEIPLTGAGLYNKSLLYLVSHAFEPAETRQLLGLARHVDRDRDGSDRDADPIVKAWLEARAGVTWRRPELEAPGATLHGSFDDDGPTLEALIAGVAGPRGPAGGRRRPG